MKTLYITDLDGTLLGDNAELSPYTANALNCLLERGVCISVATARTEATVVQLLRGINLSVPVILMNGVAIYDIKKGEYLKTCVMDASSLSRIIKILQKRELTGFLYTMEQGKLKTYYENLDRPQMKEFHDERVIKFNKPFHKVSSFCECLDRDVIYFSLCEKEELLLDAYQELKTDDRLGVEFYRDNYRQGYWFLEVFASGASKRNAVVYLKEFCGFDRVISFGDNLNDLSLFSASDACFAVANAKEEVKVKATRVIGSNDEDGVAKWLEEHAVY